MRPTWHWTERSPRRISARNPSPNSPSVCGSSYSVQATLKYCTRLLTITRPLMLLWPLDRKLHSEFLSRRGMTIRFRLSRCYIHTRNTTIAVPLVEEWFTCNWSLIDILFHYSACPINTTIAHFSLTSNITYSAIWYWLKPKIIP